MKQGYLESTDRGLRCGELKWFISSENTKRAKALLEVGKELGFKRIRSLDQVSPKFRTKMEALIWAKWNHYEIMN